MDDEEMKRWHLVEYLIAIVSAFSYIAIENVCKRKN